MQTPINFTGHNFEITPALRTLTEDKLQRLTRYFERIQSMDVTFFVENHTHIVEAKLSLNGTMIHARAEDLDMYKAIDGLEEKLERQVHKFKEKLHSHRDRDTLSDINTNESE